MDGPLVICSQIGRFGFLRVIGKKPGEGGLLFPFENRLALFQECGETLDAIL